ncbi:MAG: PIG-L deacetylase family protein, partial [Burkholderiaceae bacterium]
MAAVSPAPELSRAIVGDGTAEARWMNWRWLADCPSQSLDAWVSPSSRLVVVAPHPDDEILICGALVHQHVRRGGSCTVVAVTDGEASHPATPQRSAAALGTIRRQERLEGLRRLGLSDPHVVRLGVADGAVQKQESELANRLASMLLETDVVVTTWQLDGHPDHEACGRATTAACDAVGIRCLQAPVWLWHWATPQAVSVPWHRLQALHVDADTRLRKRDALAAHHSQLTTEPGREAILGLGIRERAVRTREH